MSSWRIDNFQFISLKLRNQFAEVGVGRSSNFPLPTRSVSLFFDTTKQLEYLRATGNNPDQIFPVSMSSPDTGIALLDPPAEGPYPGQSCLFSRTFPDAGFDIVPEFSLLAEWPRARSCAGACAFLSVDIRRS